MIEGVSPSLIQGLSAVGLLILILVGFLTALKRGLIYVKPQHDSIVEVYKERVKDAKEREERAFELAAKWQDVADKWQAVAQEAVSQGEAELEQGRTIIALIESLRASQRGPRR